MLCLPETGMNLHPARACTAIAGTADTDAVTALLDLGPQIPVAQWRALLDTVEAGVLDGPHSAALLARDASAIPHSPSRESSRC